MSPPPHIYASTASRRERRRWNRRRALRPVAFLGVFALLAVACAVVLLAAVV